MKNLFQETFFGVTFPSKDIDLSFDKKFEINLDYEKPFVFSLDSDHTEKAKILGSLLMQFMEKMKDEYEFCTPDLVFNFAFGRGKCIRAIVYYKYKEK